MFTSETIKKIPGWLPLVAKPRMAPGYCKQKAVGKFAHEKLSNTQPGRVCLPQKLKTSIDMVSIFHARYILQQEVVTGRQPVYRFRWKTIPMRSGWIFLEEGNR